MAFGLALALPCLAAQDGLRAGVGTVDITPQGEKVRDPLRVKALVLQQGKTKVALAVCDLGGVSRDVSEEVRQRAARETGIPASQITVAATHTHTGGRHPELTNRIVQAIAEAHGALRPAVLEGRAARKEGLTFNRRFLMKDGTVRFNPGYRAGVGSFDGGHSYLNPEIVRPVGPSDPEVGMLIVRDAEGGRPRAAVVNFALHVVTTEGGGISADYPHFIQEALRAKYGPEFVSLFVSGAAGDINNWDVSKPGPQQNYRITRAIGETLAESVAAAIDAPQAGRAMLAMRSEQLSLPIQPVTEMDVAWARHAVETQFKDFGGAGYNQIGFLAGVRARRTLHLAELWKKGPEMPVLVQVWRLSPDAAMVALPGEIFVELGLAIKKRSPFRTTLVVELANDTISYVPTMKAFGEGGYEVVNSRLAPGGGERMVESAVRMLNDLRAGK